MEQLKVELRSILISSKHGVAEKDISNDYELLMCQRLPYKELGYKDVSSLLRAMPDVAREHRSPSGEITYHAVCDESTAHIQKLVSNQASKKKKTTRGGLRGRGRGGTFRGGGATFRGGAFKGGPPRGRGGTGRGGRGGSSRGTSGRFNGPRGGRGGRSTASSDHQHGSGDFRNRDGKTSMSTFHISKSSSTGGQGKFLQEEDSWETEGKSNNTHSKGPRPICGRGGDNQPFDSPDEDDLEKETESTSPMINLRIGVSGNGGRRVEAKTSPLAKGKNTDGANYGEAGQKDDLRNLLNRRRANTESSSEMPSTQGTGFGGKGSTFNPGANRGKKLLNTSYKDDFQKNLPPRFRKKPLGESDHNRQISPPPPELPKSPPTPPYHGIKVIQRIDEKNWTPPENGELYLQTYYNYFAQLGEEAPVIEVIEGYVNKEKGYYGRLLYREQYYYPLEILHTEEQARQNAARSFCVSNNIPLPALIMPDLPMFRAEEFSSGRDYPLLDESSSGRNMVVSTSPSPNYTPPWAAQLTQHLESFVPKERPASPQHQEVSQPVPFSTPPLSKAPFAQPLAQPLAQQPVPAHPVVAPVQHDPLVEAKEKIYKMIKDSGMWLKSIPDLYLKTYGENLNLDLHTVMGQWTDFFTTEEIAPKRFIVYPVPNALSQKPTQNLNNNTSSEVNANVFQQPFVTVPPYQVFPPGTQLSVMFSFAYSALDVYFKKTATENLSYEMDEILNSDCPTMSPLKKESIVVSSMVAANYEGGWYRAQVQALEPTQATVYFIDYGNVESLSFMDLRPVPEHSLTLTTPPLAIRCALRKTQPGEWLPDVGAILNKISENCSELIAVITENRGNCALVDLYLPEGNLVNPMLIQESYQPPLTPRGAGSYGQQPPLPAISTPQQQSQQEPATTPKTFKHTPLRAGGVNLFAKDPPLLEIPESETFAVYICRVMSDRSVLLRIVDEDYSDKLDELEQAIAENFYTWPMPQKIKQSNIYAGMVLATADDAQEEDFDQNKYNRVRVLKENKNGTFDCYLPDHGDHETLSRDKLREIDPDLNSSLSYQATLATLHGLENMPVKLQPYATEILIKLLLSAPVPFFAVKAGRSANKNEDSFSVDQLVVDRTRKIISCMKEINPVTVAKVYQDVYKVPIENVEEVIKHIPGYGYWRETLEVELYDTSQEDEEINLNQYVLATVKEMEEAEAQGRAAKDVMRSLFDSSSTSQPDTEIDSVTSGEQGFGSSHPSQEVLQEALGKLSVDTDRVSDYVQNLPENSSGDGPGKLLYTWSTAGNGSMPPCRTPSSSPHSSSTPSVCDNLEGNPPPTLPKHWPYPLFTSISLHITYVESPSNFVAIPMEQRGALEKIEAAMTQYFSNPISPATNLTEDALYAVKYGDSYRRALYIQAVRPVLKIFFPDHHSFDTVDPMELFPLPEQFYSLPFLAYKMRLGGIIPTGQDWETDVKEWFKKSIGNKSLYAMVTNEDGSDVKAITSTGSKNLHVPSTLVVRLIDTSGEEDVVVDEYMEEHGMAVRDTKN